MKKISVFFVIIGFLFVLVQFLPGLTFMSVMTVTGGEDRTFYKQYHRAIADANSLLVKQGLCADVQDCRRKNFLFIEGRRQGFAAMIYGINDQKILGQVVQIYTNTFTDHSGIKYMEINAYAFPKEKDFTFPFPPIPVTKWTYGTILNVTIHRD